MQISPLIMTWREVRILKLFCRLLCSITFRVRKNIFQMDRASKAIEISIEISLWGPFSGVGINLRPFNCFLWLLMFGWTGNLVKFFLRVLMAWVSLSMVFSCWCLMSWRRSCSDCTQIFHKPGLGLRCSLGQYWRPTGHELLLMCCFRTQSNFSRSRYQQDVCS